MWIRNYLESEPLFLTLMNDCNFTIYREISVVFFTSVFSWSQSKESLPGFDFTIWCSTLHIHKASWSTILGKFLEQSFLFDSCSEVLSESISNMAYHSEIWTTPGSELSPDSKSIVLNHLFIFHFSAVVLLSIPI